MSPGNPPLYPAAFQPCVAGVGAGRVSGCEEAKVRVRPLHLTWLTHLPDETTPTQGRKSPHTHNETAPTQLNDTIPSTPH